MREYCCTFMNFFFVVVCFELNVDVDMIVQ